MKKYLGLLIIFFVLGLNLEAQKINQEYIQQKYTQTVDKIIQKAFKDSTSWERLAELCDNFGHRFSGSKSLEQAIDWCKNQMIKDKFDYVGQDEVMIPHWSRGKEYCKMVAPREADIPMISLGGSVGTGKKEIEADVIVVNSFDDLSINPERFNGKIILYNVPFKNYGQAVQYRFAGAIRAAQVGAVASLIRSVSPNTSRNLHTGSMSYSDTVTKIPHAAISPEDAMLLERFQKRGITPRVRLYMEAETLPDVKSSNVYCEIKGTEFPDEVIAIGGHIDSWDVGSGAQDDGSGIVATWEAVKLLKDLGLRPKRTIRAVMWVNEENGVRGGNAYKDHHENEPHVLMFEQDGGVFRPESIGYSGPDSLFTYASLIEPMLKKIDTISVKKGGGGVDISPMVKTGVPGSSIHTDDLGKYFYYHHSGSDTPDKVDPFYMNSCVATIATFIYIYADLPTNLNTKGKHDVKEKLSK